MSKVSVLRLELFKHSRDSFLAALDTEGIPHGEVHQFSSGSQASALVESLSAISEIMPWKSIAKVMVAWVKARKSREIIITTGAQKVIYLKDYSVSEAEKVIKSAVNATIIDTVPNDET